MKLNCDVGEGLDEVDNAILPWVDQASIACGGHVGDELTMSRTVRLALKHNVIIGAHPSYPDKENFGRKSLNINHSELKEAVTWQIKTLSHIARQYDTALEFIKPHGALYHDALTDNKILALLIHVADNFKLPLMLQSYNNNHSIVQPTKLASTAVLFEAFVDRLYTDEGFLVSRNYEHAVIKDEEKIKKQTLDIVKHKRVLSENGHWLSIQADSLCIHSDTANAAHLCQIVRHTLDDQL